MPNERAKYDPSRDEDEEFAREPDEDARTQTGEAYDRNRLSVDPLAEEGRLKNEAAISAPGSDTTRLPASKMAGGQATATAADLGQGGRDPSADEDEVTAQSQESFPASDPPSWIPERP